MVQIWLASHAGKTLGHTGCAQDNKKTMSVWKTYILLNFVIYA